MSEIVKGINVIGLAMEIIDGYTAPGLEWCNQTTYGSRCDVFNDALQPAQFETLAKRVLKHKPYMVAMDYVPKVPDSERDLYELMASNYYNISINIRDRSGNISLIQDVYFPILFRYPWENTTDVLLVDSLAGLRGEALNRSIISGKVATTESILLYVGSRIERGFVLYEPIFVNNTLLGFAASIFRISSLIYDILGRLTPASVRILFFDQMDDAHRAAGDKYGDYLDALIRDDELNVWKLQVKDGVEIGDIHQSIDDEKVFNLEETLEVGDRSWTLVMYSTGDFLNDFQTSTPEAILSA
eukprot:306180_1